MLAGANLDAGRSASSRELTEPERSSPLVGLTSAAGRWSAMVDWKRTSSWKAIATAVSTITAPSACWRCGARPARAAPHPLDHRPPRQSENEQHGGRADGVGESDGHRPPRGGADRHDGGE